MRQGGEDGLILEGGLTQELIRSINDTSEKLSAEGRPSIMVVAPQIRRVFSDFVCSHVPDLIVLSFTELPENRRVEVYATIGEKEKSIAEDSSSGNSVSSEKQLENA